MAFSKCGSCNSTFFEVKEAEPRDSRYELMFVQCSSCGSVVGTMPYYDPGILAKDNQKEIAALKQQLSQIEHHLSQIQRHLRQ